MEPRFEARPPWREETPAMKAEPGADTDRGGMAALFSHGTRDPLRGAEAGLECQPPAIVAVKGREAKNI